MASIQDPEIQFAQKLACNEKAIRNKALKKLRKYISVRSLKLTGGFTADEILKLWKGLFYCLWMQDKPLLQEKLSDDISTLIHNFCQFDTKLLYLESFLITMKREWTGIDRLRMDKFFQLVRFMFRQMFGVLKKKQWKSSEITKFLHLMTTQLLQTTSEAPSGLQLHILDLYMTELAAVGAAELTASQNLMFIEPFCKTAAKTKNWTLLSSICTSIFSVIIDQAPFAIEELMKEVKAAEVSDSDSSEEHSEEQEHHKLHVSRKAAVKRINGAQSQEEEDDSDEDTDTECWGEDDNIEPVLQFDYAAVADKLFEFASRSGTPASNRVRLYKVIKVLRDLSEGVFPQNVYPEEVSTDEDDDMFASRKKMKRRQSHMNGTKDGAPAAKKKEKQEGSDKQNKDSEPGDLAAGGEKKKTKRKRKKKRAAKKGESSINEKESDASGTLPSSATSTQAEPLFTVCKDQSKKRKRDLLEPQIEKQLTPPPSVEPEIPCEAHDLVSEKKKKRKSLAGERDEALLAVIDGSLDEEIRAAAAAPVTLATTPTKRMNKGPERDVKIGETKADTDVSPVSCEPMEEVTSALSETNCTSLSKKKKGLKAEEKLEHDACSVQDPMDDPPTTRLEQITCIIAPLKQKGHKKNRKADKEEAAGQQTQPESHNTDDVLDELQQTTKVPPRKATKKNNKQRVEVDQPNEEPTGESGSCGTSQKKTPDVKECAGSMSESLQGADGQNQLFEITITTPTKKTASLQPKAAQLDGIVINVADTTDSPSGKTVKKKKRKIPVVFEFEEPEISDLTTEETTSNQTQLTNEEQTACLESKKVTFGLKNNKTAEFRKTDRSLLVSPDGTSRVPFDPQQKPKCGVLKSPLTRLSSSSKKTRVSASNSLPKKSGRPSAADFF